MQGLFCPNEILKCLYFISMYTVLNEHSECLYFYLLKFIIYANINLIIV